MSGRHLQNLILPVSLQKECMPVHVKKFSDYFKKMKDANIFVQPISQVELISLFLNFFAELHLKKMKVACQ